MPATPTGPAALSLEDIRELCGDMLDWKLAAIEALHPTAGDVAAAVAWVNGEDDLGRAGRPLEGLAAQVYDLLKADDYPDDR